VTRNREESRGLGVGFGRDFHKKEDPRENTDSTNRKQEGRRFKNRELKGPRRAKKRRKHAAKKKRRGGSRF